MRIPKPRNMKLRILDTMENSFEIFRHHYLRFWEFHFPQNIGRDQKISFFYINFIYIIGTFTFYLFFPSIYVILWERLLINLIL
jgi:hypothetical protein